MSNAEDSPEFKAHALEWLRQEQGIGAASVESVCGGSSREEIAQSLYAEVFGVDVNYVMRDGERRVMNVCAGDMALAAHQAGKDPVAFARHFTGLRKRMRSGFA